MIDLVNSAQNGSRRNLGGPLRVVRVRMADGAAGIWTAQRLPQGRDKVTVIAEALAAKEGADVDGSPTREQWRRAQAMHAKSMRGRLGIGEDDPAERMFPVCLNPLVTRAAIWADHGKRDASAKTPKAKRPAPLIRRGVSLEPGFTVPNSAG